MLHFLPTGELVLYLSSTAQILNICSIIATMHVIKNAKYYISIQQTNCQKVLYQQNMEDRLIKSGYVFPEVTYSYWLYYIFSLIWAINLHFVEFLIKVTVFPLN